jgi:hypothetical protein
MGLCHQSLLEFFFFFFFEMGMVDSSCVGIFFFLLVFDLGIFGVWFLV